MLISTLHSHVRISYFAMSVNVEKASVRWHELQEVLFANLLCMPEFKPIGGDGDGVMARMVEKVWQPLLDKFLEENEKLVARAQTTSTGLSLKKEFNIKTLKKKYDLFRDRYTSLKRECNVGRHQLRGETGAAADGQPNTAQAAIDAATKKWPLFSQWHASFGCLQRLRDDTWHETISPLKPTNPAAAVAGSSAAEGTSAGKTRLPTLGSPQSISDENDDAEDELLDPQVPKEEEEAAQALQQKKPVKRSRLSSRDERLGRSLVDSRMRVAERSAELRQATAREVVDMTHESKKELVTMQSEVQERIAQKDRDAQLEVKKREEVMEMTRLYVADGMKPAEARKMAIKDVYGERV
jgi:hypothetical protein